MHGSVSGPLGALLLIAPLAAIPVFAIVGVPQFAPVIASSSDDDDFSDLGASTASLESSTDDLPPRSRGADDLFAPHSERSRVDAPAGTRSPARQFAGSNSSAGQPQRPAPTLPPPGALDHWEIRPDTGNGLTVKNSEDPAGGSGTARDGAPRTGDLQIPAEDLADGQVSVEEFSPDLLKLNSNPMRKEAHATPRMTPDKSRSAARETPKGELPEYAGARPRASDSLPEPMSEHSGWQAAARHLKELGIRKYRLEPQLEEVTFTFTCTFASPNNPRVVRRFEAVADTPLEAVQDVLAQIDDWRAGDSRNRSAAVPADDAQDP